MWTSTIIIVIFLLILCWFLFAPLELQMDTRTPQVFIRWFSIGKATVVYENGKWSMRVKIQFFRKQWELEKLVFSERRKKKRVKRIVKKKKARIQPLRKVFILLKSFRIVPDLLEKFLQKRTRQDPNRWPSEGKIDGNGNGICEDPVLVMSRLEVFY